MNFYFTHKFLFWLRFGKRGLLYDFNSEYLFGLLRYEFITSGESTFSKEVAFKVGGDLVIIKIVILYDFEVLMWIRLGLSHFSW